MLRSILLALLLAATAHAQWAIQTSNTTADLRGIDNVGHGIAWASGSNGTVLHTTDNGTTWLLCKTPPDAEHLDFRGIQAFDANTAIIMSSGKGDLSRLYKTIDGCQTWRLVFTNPDKDGFWDSLRFEEVDPRYTHNDIQGILVGDPVDGRFAIFISSHFGESWTSLSQPPISVKRPKAKSGEALFAASNTAADAVGDANNLAFVSGGTAGSLLYHLSGGGLAFDTWMTLPAFEVTQLDFPHSSESQGAFAMAHRKVDNVTFDFMIVGGNYSKPESAGFAAYVPAATYKFFVRHQPAQAATTPPHGYRSAVAYDAPTNTWITVGPNGTDISTDDGRNWRALKPSATDTPDADQHWNALSLPFVVGPHGRIGILLPTALQPAKSP